MTAPFGTPVLRENSSAPPTALLQEHPLRELRKGDVLYRAHQPAETAYRIDEGLLKIVFDTAAGRERILALVGPGEWVGALAPNHLHLRERAVALSPRVRVHVLPREGLHAGLERRLFDAAGARLARLRDALEDAELPVRTRLARAFLRLGDRFGQPGEAGYVRLTLPLTHETLAGLIGAARETTTALLSELRRAGAVEGTRGRYRLHTTRLLEVASHGLDGA